MSYIVDFLLLAVLYFWLFYKKWYQQGKEQWLLKTLMYIYMTMVLFFTLMPFPLPMGGTNYVSWQSVNLTPFRDVIQHYRGAHKEIILNIVMTIPFGVLYPLIWKKNIWKTVFVTFLLSLSIESIQLLGSWWGVHSRAFDVTDLITNTIGGFIGYMIFLLLKPVIEKLLNAWHS
ncbi:antibiotic resistance protein VanZ [Lysinibacillus piscis]|uniref:Antibiotic resistance protein VanZ n=1 Tax=Lysinibacillus piscis TaxID=2518931 RepID=A0ABQ5NIE6_9BACI|nr:antibiotic resistance protein VanZ [Lysinibacillus sp. KH24]